MVDLLFAKATAGPQRLPPGLLSGEDYSQQGRRRGENAGSRVAELSRAGELRQSVEEQFQHGTLNEL